MEAWEVDLLLTGLAEEADAFDAPAQTRRADDPLLHHDPEVTPEWVASLPAN